MDGEAIVVQEVKLRLIESCFVMNHSEGRSSCGFLQPALLLILLQQ